MSSTDNTSNNVDAKSINKNNSNSDAIDQAMQGKTGTDNFQIDGVEIPQKL